MNLTVEKKKFPLRFVIIIFLVIIIIMFIANRLSTRQEEIQVPFNNGFESLNTYGDCLAAVTFDDLIYVWDWNDLKQNCRTTRVLSDEAVLLNSQFVASVQKENPRTIVVKNIETGKVNQEIFLDSEMNKANLSINGDQKTVVLMLRQTKESKGSINCQFRSYRVDFNNLVFMNEAAFNYPVGSKASLTVSDDGKLAAVCGASASGCWIALCDIKEKKTVWEKKLPEPELFFNCVFSPDSKAIDTRGSDCTVYQFDAASGEITRRLLAAKANKITIKDQNIQSVKVSSDGRLIGAVVFRMVYVWDSKSGELLFSKSPAHKLVSAIAFSSDSRFLATCDLRQGGTIKVWRMP